MEYLVVCTFTHMLKIATINRLNYIPISCSHAKFIFSNVSKFSPYMYMVVIFPLIFVQQLVNKLFSTSKLSHFMVHPKK